MRHDARGTMRRCQAETGGMEALREQRVCRFTTLAVILFTVLFLGFFVFPFSNGLITRLELR